MYENAQALQMSGEVNGCRSGLLLLIAGRRILSAKIFRICTADQTGQRLKDEKASNNGGLLGCRRQNSAVTRQQMAKVATQNGYSM